MEALDRFLALSPLWQFSAPLVVVLLIFSPVAILAYADYRSWYSLGPGGLPHNVAGWMAQSLLRLLCSSDVHELAYYDRYAIGREAQSYLPEALVKRDGRRPTVSRWAAPHRQLDMESNADLKQV
jgi:hypothetical protein